jgi:hypothetical protein
MRRLSNYLIGFVSACLLAFVVVACSSVDEKPAPAAAPKPAAVPPPAPAPAPAKTAEGGKSPGAEAAKASKTKAVEVEGIISAVGQRTVTFQVERKGKVREEVVGVDEKTKIDKAGASVKLRDLQETDKALINYEPEAYTPAIAIKVTGKGKIQKVGGDD